MMRATGTSRIDEARNNDVIGFSDQSILAAALLSSPVALTIARMLAFRASGKPGQDERIDTSPSLWCFWLVPWAGSLG
jgi:hypothetical protein